MIRFHQASVFLIATALLVSTLPAGCQPITAPGTVYAAPQAAFTLALPPDFAVAPDASVGSAHWSEIKHFSSLSSRFRGCNLEISCLSLPACDVISQKVTIVPGVTVIFRRLFAVSVRNMPAVAART